MIAQQGRNWIEARWEQNQANININQYNSI